MQPTPSSNPGVPPAGSGGVRGAWAEMRASGRALTACLREGPAFVLVLLGIAAAVPLVFVFSTHLIWEDYFITYRYSENLARGLGLVYSPGERVQGFTSPLNTLIPAFFAWMSGARNLFIPLWGYRIVSYAALGFGLVAVTSVLTARGVAPRAARWAGALFPLLAVLEIKTTAFAMSGQESGFVIGFLASAFALACLGWTAHAWLGGVLWAGLMYSRPDACVYIAALGLVAWSFSPGARGACCRALVKSGLVCAALYLPWFLFTWCYYGSPVPHTITAKYGIGIQVIPIFRLIGPLVVAFEHVPKTLTYAFAPIYDPLTLDLGHWPDWIHDAGFLLALAAIAYWLIPTRDRIGRMASLAAFLIFAYQNYVSEVAQFAPWYYPPLAFMGALALTCALAALARGLRPERAAAAAAALGLAGLLAFFGYIFCASLSPLRVKQQVIDWGNRRAVGLWLRDHVAPGESVYLEPLGYIGYFSQAKMLDWPGLVSPEVVAARRRLTSPLAYTWQPVAEALKPAWIVARYEEAGLMQQSPALSRDYELLKVFDVRDQVRPLAARTGMNLIGPEALFCVYHRIAP